jgi:ubiquinone/menaquinone biosynthesis C-methylase UbiE
MSPYGLGFADRSPYVACVNENHAELCSSPGWSAYIQGEVLPSLTCIAPLGEEMLELGPGPGAATEWLRLRVRRLVAVESDVEAAQLLSARYADTNVEVVRGSACELDFPSGGFDSVGSFTMLHHVASSADQQSLLREAFRVLRPGGVFLGSDSLASDELHRFHDGDVYNPVDPASFLVRLQSVGFAQVTIVVDSILKFVARKPDQSCNANESERTANDPSL